MAVRRSSVNTWSNAELVAALSRRDQDALAELHHRHWRMVHRLAERLCGRWRADDVTQEVFLRLWNKPERYQPARGSLQRFLLMQAWGGGIDALRSDRARGARERAELGRRTRVGAEVEPLALALLDADAIAVALATLPELERNAVVLAYFGGYSYREVAVLLATPEGTVKSRIRSALVRLRVELAAEDPVGHPAQVVAP